MDLRYWRVQLLKRLQPRHLIQFNPTKIPFIARKLEKLFLAGDDMLVLPRDTVISVNKPLDAPGQEILPTKVVEHFIKKAGYICLINTCLCRDGLKCKDYPIAPGCLYLGEAARGVHPRLGRQASVAEALAHVRRSQELGLVSIIGKSKLDCITHGIGPGGKLMAICNCCPCCCVARGLAYVPRVMNEKFSRMPGVEVTVAESCTGCGLCAQKEICIFQAIALDRGKARINPEKCRGCSRCVNICPPQAIKITIDRKDYIGQTIKRLEKSLDVT